MNKLLISFNKPCVYRRLIPLAMLAIVTFPGSAGAQYFSATKGDLIAGFRKSSPYQGSYELVVKLGSVTNFLALPAGTTIPMNNFTPTQLSAAFSDYNNLQWSVFSRVNGAPNSSWSGYHLGTIWFTLPRSAAGTQTMPPARAPYGSQGYVTSDINSIADNAALYSSSQGSTSQNNSAVLVRELVGNQYAFSQFIANPLYPAVGDFGGNLAAGNAENTTPASFTAAVVSDLYQSVPQTYVDPTTGTYDGAAYYVGYFTLNPDGTMTFTRASAVTAPPPAPTITAITRTGNTANISFTTTTGSFTYSLYYTNSAGLAASTTNWPHAASVNGDGSVKTLSDTTTDANRFYRIGAQ